MPSTRSSTRQDSSPMSKDSASNNGTPNKAKAGSKRKAETASPSSTHGKKQQKTLEQVVPGAENDDGAKESNGSGNGPNETTDAVLNDAKVREDHETGTQNSHNVEDGKAADNDKKAHTKSGKVNDHNGAIVEDPKREESVSSNVLEKGIIYFFFRGRVGIEEPQGVQDIARSYIVLRPLPIGAKLGDGPLEDAGNNRLLALPKKVLPKSNRDRFMVFVEKAKTSVKDLRENFIAASDYATQTAGTRHTPAATPAGEGVYAMTSTGRESHLAYILTRPEKLNEVQEELGLRNRGSFITSIKNPKVPGPANASLPNPADYPKEFFEEFRGRGWMPLLPKYFDYANTQCLLIGEGQGEIRKAAEGSDKDARQDKETPLEEMEKLEHEDDLRVNHLKGDDPVFEDLGLSSKEYSKLQTTW